MAVAKLSPLVVVGRKIAVATLLLSAPLIYAADSDNAVPLDDKSNSAIASLEKMHAILAEVHPGKKGSPRTVETKGGRYILYGDLFHTGQTVALVALWGRELPDLQEPAPLGKPVIPIGLGFAEWTHGSWEPRGLWHIYPVWRPHGWKSDPTTGDFLPFVPAEKPFWLKDFGGDGRPKIVVAGDVAKYYQEHHLLSFDRKKNRLEQVAEAMAAPKFVDGWVQLYHNSGRRAEFEEWTYLRWEGEKLIEKASWHDEVPYRDPDSPFIRVVRNDSKSARQEFVVRENDAGSAITRNDQPFADFTVKYRPSPPKSSADEPYAELAYLFEKLTGLPRKLCPRPDSVKPPADLEKIATIHVTGDADAVRILSP